MGSQSEQRLRNRLAPAVGKKSIPDWMWGHLKAEGFVRNALEEDEDGWDDLVEAAKRLHGTILQAGAGQSPRTHTKKGVSPLAGHGPATQKRVLAISKYMALLTAKHTKVEWFRKVFLKEGFLTPQEAKVFLTSDASRILEPKTFVEEKIPMGSHQAVIEADEYTTKQAPHCRRIAIKVTPPGRVIERIINPDAQGNYPTRLPEIFTYAEKGAESERVSFWPGSMLARLHNVAEWVSRGSPWNEPQVMWFTLTGLTPAMNTVEWSAYWSGGKDLYHGTITLKALPWIPAKEVANVFRKAQRDFIGRHNRPLTGRNVALFDYLVPFHVASEGKIKDWGALMAQWNRNTKFPGWKYKEVRLFRRDFKRAGQALVYPHYAAMNA